MTGFINDFLKKSESSTSSLLVCGMENVWYSKKGYLLFVGVIFQKSRIEIIFQNRIEEAKYLFEKLQNQISPKSQDARRNYQLQCRGRSPPAA